MENKKLQQWFTDAQKLHQKGQLDAAQREYERILQKAPDFARARVALGIVLLMKGRRTVDQLRQSSAVRRPYRRGLRRL